MNKLVSPRQRIIQHRKGKSNLSKKFPEAPRRPLDRTQGKPIPTLALSNVSSPKHHRSPVGSSTRETSRKRRQNLTINISNINE